ncbi:tryptophan--tRNA ligase [Alienimonas sp. DA493]|uniref:tryptophan--tRNA ligase n=1 Tax=Alienimonas sp. DA493 TaxID=3373605 RepID=UPI0037550183
MRVLSGIQPTGRFHWGNYFGAIRQYIALQTAAEEPNGRAFYFLADLHALTTIRGEPETLRQHTRDAALDLLALGLDPDRATLFRQSDVPEVTELFWALLTVTQMHLLDKGHSYKEKKARGLPADAGLYTYPILQAADILLYDSDTVPVGADQVQHIEITRDLAERFNHIYSADVLVPPKAYVLDDSAKVIGLDGEKMSKSYGNTIEIFESPKKLKKKCNSIVTDSLSVEDKKEPEGDNVFTLYKLFATPEQREELAAKYRAGGMGYGEAKKALIEAATAYFAPAVERRAAWEARPDDVEDVLRSGAEKAREVGGEVLDRVRTACGLAARR